MSFSRFLSAAAGSALWGLCTGFALLHPQPAAQALHTAFALCTGPLLPALFPFLVLSRMVFMQGSAGLLGQLFRLPARLAGVRKPCAGLPVLLGWTGGFAPAATALFTLYKQEALSPRECTGLLPLCLCIGPGFLVGAVGAALGNPLLGGLLYLAQLCACMVCALLLRVLLGSPSEGVSAAAPLPTVTLPQAIGDAVAAYGKVSGCVLFFAFLTAALQAALPEALHGLLALGMEVSAGCLYAATQPAALPLCCLAVSLLGCAGWCQLRALLPRALPLWHFLLLRPVHTACMWGFLRLFLWLLPGQLAPVYSSLSPEIALRQRASPAPLLLLFLLLCRVAALLSSTLPLKKHDSVLY